MLRYFSVLIGILLLFIIVSPVNAHTEADNRSPDYSITFEHQPLSPFVGENIEFIITIDDEEGHPVNRFAGKVVIKKFTTKEYVGKDAVSATEEIHQSPVTADQAGTAVFTYTFPEEGIYDVELEWGNGQSAGTLLQVREPTSFFASQEISKRIFLFIGIALGGMIVGGSTVFFLLTTTLHPKR